MEHESNSAAGTGRTVHAPGAAARVAMRLVRIYQHVFSFRPSPCRYIPSCSNYALDAFEYTGFWRGLWLTVRRIARCNPWGGHGWDPVPGCDHLGHGNSPDDGRTAMIKQDAA